MSNDYTDFIDSLKVGFIDKNHIGPSYFKPTLVTNRVQRGDTVLAHILHELETAKSFHLSVAFITESGLAMLKSVLYDLKEKGVKGRLLTSTYLQFNEPHVFRELLKLENVEVRLAEIEGFHPKGYLFEQDEHYTLLIGSANLTAQALKVNHEWNIKVTSYENGELLYDAYNYFDETWEQAIPLTASWLSTYERSYVQLPSTDPIPLVEEPLYNSVQPNEMQKEALKQLALLREQGKKKGLVISATGTGKTYLSAFDVAQVRPKRLLFIAHRERILRDAQKSFERILGGQPSDYGFYVGNEEEVTTYTFASIQKFSSPDHYLQYPKDTFDYILIDEAHRVGGETYQRLLHYFEPQFLLGMTATPERTDHYDVFRLFDYNIAYEIRLQDALEENMLTPFHYYGVTGYSGIEKGNDHEPILTQLTTEERVNHIVDKIEYYGYSGDRVCGLMFVSRIDEAEALSKLLNERGYRTIALSGKNSEQEREEAISALESGRLDYILTVDIFNEGIDIPKLNQIVMLRPTESSIIFIQQLGRGLRLHKEKEFVTVIDFIGNYQNNYLIPIALSGDQSGSRDNLRRYIQETAYIPGVTTIHFERIAKERVFQAIDRVSLTTFSHIKTAYEQLKKKLGRTPYLYDFYVHESLDPVVIVDEHDGKSLHHMRNYYQVLKRFGAHERELPDAADRMLSLLSHELLNGKRPHELYLIDSLLRTPRLTDAQYAKLLQKRHLRSDEKTRQSVYRVLDLSFWGKVDRKKYRYSLIETNSGEVTLSEVFLQELRDPYFMKLVQDVIQTGLERSARYDKKRIFTLYEKYTRKDASRLLNWPTDEKGTIFGYKIAHQSCPIFITYDKDTLDEDNQYADEFLSPQWLKWYTRAGQTLKGKDVQNICRLQKEGGKLSVFVKKNDDEKAHFYYLGTARVAEGTMKEEVRVNKKGKKESLVSMKLILEKPVKASLYDYIVYR